MSQRNGTTAVSLDRWDVRNFLVLRDARPEEDERIGQFLVDVFESTTEAKLRGYRFEDERRRDLRDVRPRRTQGTVRILELGYRIVGTFTLLPATASVWQGWLPGAANLRCVAVDPDFQGYGFSALLLEDALALSARWEVPAVCLHVQRGAEGVAKLYARLGFVRDPRGDHRLPADGYEGYTLYRDQVGPIAWGNA